MSKVLDMVEGEGMSYDTLPAGREMDALVAEKIMGCTALVRKDYSWKLSGGDIEGFSGTVWFCKCAGMHNAQSDDGLIKPYSTSIYAAWEVIEKMWAMKWFAEIFHQCVDGTWQASFMFGENDGEPEVGALAPTAPLAICRAALNAVEGT